MFQRIVKLFQDWRMEKAMRAIEAGFWSAASQGVLDVIATRPELGHWWYTGCNMSGPPKHDHDMPTVTFDFPEQYLYRDAEATVGPVGMELHLYGPADFRPCDLDPVLTAAYRLNRSKQLLDQLAGSMLVKTGQLIAANLNDVRVEILEVPSTKSFGTPAQKHRNYVRFHFHGFYAYFKGIAASDEDCLKRSVVYHDDCNFHVR